MRPRGSGPPQATAPSQPGARRCYLVPMDAYEREFAGRHRLHDVVDYWARRNPEGVALFSYDTERTVRWADFAAHTRIIARRFLARGFRKGHIVATSLPFSLEHIWLEYACFRIGVMVAPLDLRLRPAEVGSCLRTVQASWHVTLQNLHEFIEEGDLASEEALRQAAAQVSETDAALAIFTTGSTGSPKPALLSHRNITVQNMCLGSAFGFREGMPLLVNLPPSHVGGQTEALMTSLFFGGPAIVLPVFDPAKSLAAIRDCKIRVIGQIPAMFYLEWRHPDFATADLSSLELALYGGQQVTPPFLKEMSRMAPRIGTGLGLTECAGFCTYTPAGMPVEEMAASLGFSHPAYPMSIREPLQAGGRAGRELPDGEIGYVCFHGPQTFLGYGNDPEATRQTISSDGYLYTGDLGSRGPWGLQLAGRAKWVIKPAGYQVFPGDVERHFAELPQVAACAAVGAPHRTLSEAIVMFVELKPGSQISLPELRRHARGIASYMRPLHYVKLEPGQLPVNRAVKLDYVRLSEMAREEVEKLRAAGRWDA